jgi:hypothetical protein
VQQHSTQQGGAANAKQQQNHKQLQSNDESTNPPLGIHPACFSSDCPAAAAAQSQLLLDLQTE